MVVIFTSYEDSACFVFYLEYLCIKFRQIVTKTKYNHPIRKNYILVKIKISNWVLYQLHIKILCVFSFILDICILNRTYSHVWTSHTRKLFNHRIEKNCLLIILISFDCYFYIIRRFCMCFIFFYQKYLFIKFSQIRTCHAFYIR